MKRRQNLLDIVEYNTPIRQITNDIDDSDVQRNDISHDEGELSTIDMEDDPVTLANTEYDPVILTNAGNLVVLTNADDPVTLANAADDPVTLANVEARQKTDSESVDSFKSVEALQKCIEEKEELISLLKHEVGLKTVTSSPALRMADDDVQTKFYTGLPSYKIFALLLEKLKTVVPLYSRLGLEAHDQFLMVLMKLRLAVPNKDLGYRFGVHVTRVSKIFHHWIDIMSRELKQLISWPDHIVSMENLPSCFKPEYKRTKCIIDCSEIFIQRPTSLSARSETYSNYKGHNTVKFLIAISPTGAITFISKCWGGRVSDKHITIHSGFLKHLINGDQVLADRGFDIAEELALQGATLAIPPYTKGKQQLSQREVEESRRLSRVRIHVERAIGRMKTYKLLHTTFPITLIKRPQDTSYATIDKILIVCAALCNIHPPLL